MGEQLLYLVDDDDAGAEVLLGVLLRQGAGDFAALGDLGCGQALDEFGAALVFGDPGAHSGEGGLEVFVLVATDVAVADGLDGVEVAGALQLVNPQFGGGVEGDAEDDGEGAGGFAGAGDASDEEIRIHQCDFDEVASRVEAVGQRLVDVRLALAHEGPQLPAGLRGVALGDPQDEAAGVGGAVCFGPHGGDRASHGGCQGGPLLEDGRGFDARG